MLNIDSSGSEPTLLAGHAVASLPPAAVFRQPENTGQVSRQFKSGAVGSLLLQITSVSLRLLISIILARWLGADGLGVYSFAFSIATILSIPTGLGLPKLVLRQVARYHASGETGLLRGLLARANQVVLALFAAVGCVAVSVLAFFSHRFDPEQYTALLWALLLVPILAASQIRQAALRGLRRIVVGQLPEQVIQPVVVVLILSGLFMIDRLTAESAMIANCAAAAVAFLAGGILLLRELPADYRRATPRYDMSAWASSLAPLSLIALVTMFSGQTHLVTLGIFSSKSDVGVFRVALSVSALALFGLSSINAALAPYAARLYHQNAIGKLQEIVTLSSRVMLAVAAASTVLFVCLGDRLIVLLYGSEFRAAYAPLVILCVGQLVNAAAGSVGLLLNMTGHETRALRVLVFTVTLDLVCTGTLVYFLGVWGAAIGTTITLIMTNVLLTWNVWKSVGINSTAFRWLIPASRQDTHVA